MLGASYFSKRDWRYVRCGGQGKIGGVNSPTDWAQKKSGSIDLSPFAARTVRVSFDADVPEANRGPGFFQLDNVALTIAGAPVILSQTRNIAAITNGTALLWVSAQGELPLQYQRYQDGVPVGSKQIGTPYFKNGAVWLPLGVASANALVESSDDLQTWSPIGVPLLIDQAWSIFDPPAKAYRFYRMRSSSSSNVP